MVTMNEVAALAGVSLATVSRVLNQQSVSPEKVRLVNKAIAELQFIPNRAARSLRMRNSDLIALVIPDIENPYFTSLARGVEDAARSAGFSVVLCNTDDDPGKEADYLDIARSQDMAGVIIATAADNSDLSSYMARGRPIVAVDRITTSHIDRVMTDDWAAGHEATTELMRRGFSRIACITGPTSTPTSTERARGWADALRESGAPTDALVRYSDFRVAGGRESILELLDLAHPPDAVMVTNNLMGVGVLQGLGEAGISPNDFGVAVIGDLPFAPVSPAITTIELPVRELGRMAVRTLLDRINGDDSPPRTIVIKNRLLEGRRVPD